MAEERVIDGVFEGGGVKGIGLIGALSVIEREGYRWGSVAGTSAGAIVAALVAAGYRAAELRDIVGTLDYNRLKDPTVVGRLPLLGALLNLLFTDGIYKGDFIHAWIEEKLAAKGVRTFGDLRNPGVHDCADLRAYRLHVITSDISRGRLAVLPTACRHYGADADRMTVAGAIRMSMSIPFFFMPVRWQSSSFVDGGMLSNFPVWLFDEVKPQPRETFGLKFIEPGAERPNVVRWIPGFAKSLITTMMDAHDKLHVEEDDFLRTIAIPTLGVKATDFGLTPQERDALFASGAAAAETFFQSWTPQNHPALVARRSKPKYQRKIKQLRAQLLY